MSPSVSAMGCGQSGQSTAKENKGSNGQAHDKQQAKEENKQYQAPWFIHYRPGGRVPTSAVSVVSTLCLLISNLRMEAKRGSETC